MNSEISSWTAVQSLKPLRLSCMIGSLLSRVRFIRTSKGIRKTLLRSLWIYSFLLCLQRLPLNIILLGNKKTRNLLNKLLKKTSSINKMKAIKNNSSWNLQLQSLQIMIRIPVRHLRAAKAVPSKVVHLEWSVWCRERAALSLLNRIKMIIISNLNRFQ